MSLIVLSCPGPESKKISLGFIVLIVYSIKEQVYKSLYLLKTSGWKLIAKFKGDDGVKSGLSIYHSVQLSNISLNCNTES